MEVAGVLPICFHSKWQLCILACPFCNKFFKACTPALKMDKISYCLHSWVRGFLWPFFVSLTQEAYHNTYLNYCSHVCIILKYHTIISFNRSSVHHPTDISLSFVSKLWPFVWLVLPNENDRRSRKENTQINPYNKALSAKLQNGHQWWWANDLLSKPSENVNALHTISSIL